MTCRYGLCRLSGKPSLCEIAGQCAWNPRGLRNAYRVRIKAWRKPNEDGASEDIQRRRQWLADLALYNALAAAIDRRAQAATSLFTDPPKHWSDAP